MPTRRLTIISSRRSELIELGREMPAHSFDWINHLLVTAVVLVKNRLDWGMLCLMGPDRYALADEAWRSLRDFHCDQVIVITGESGSGKTEASKLILQYITSAAGRSDELETIRQQLLLSNPVLEAFGNAKTVHNDNSSRFVIRCCCYCAFWGYYLRFNIYWIQGKYIELEFDHRGEPIGGLTTNCKSIHCVHLSVLQIQLDLNGTHYFVSEIHHQWQTSWKRYVGWIICNQSMTDERCYFGF